MSEETPIGRFYDAFNRGDVAALRACLTPDARVWHSFDGIAQSVDEAVAAWEPLFANSRGREIHDVRVRAFPGGLVQQHVFVIATASGGRIGWPVCVVAAIEDGRIARFDEYIDRAGSFSVGDGPVTTPGF